MTQSVTDLTQRLIAIPSVCQRSNAAISDYLSDLLKAYDFAVERLEYDDAGERKVSLVAKRGRGTGGIGFFSHSDTVDGAEAVWPAFEPMVAEGRLYGRGSCDMKGPLAATIVAACNVPISALRKPVYIVITADEENGFGGAKSVAERSQTFQQDGWPELGVIAEPTGLQVVYAHKGGYIVTVTAHGKAAHSSTDQGISANFLIAPFLAEMAELKRQFMHDHRFMNAEFNPPTNGFNMTLSDYGTAPNVTAAQTTCTLGLRSMPNADSEEAVAMIVAAAKRYGLTTTSRGYPPFYSSPDAEVVQLALAATGKTRAITVPYGTDALIFHPYLPLVVLGPGDIAQAHTTDEFIAISELEASVGIYETMIRRSCA
jgi:acetylornithine deacetylase